MATGATLISDTRQQADAVHKIEFLPDAELLVCVNDGIRELWDLLVSADPNWGLASPASTSLTANDNTYTLPATFYRLAGVDRDMGGSNYAALPSFNFEHRNDPGYLGYRLAGLELRVEPASRCAGSYRVWYVETAPELASTAATLDTRLAPWKRFIVLTAAISALTKEETDASPLIALRNGYVATIGPLMRNRDVGRPERVTDVRPAWWGMDPADWLPR
jgi:hypothetical protein